MTHTDTNILLCKLIKEQVKTIQAEEGGQQVPTCQDSGNYELYRQVWLGTRPKADTNPDGAHQTSVKRRLTYEVSDKHYYCNVKKHIWPPPKYGEVLPRDKVISRRKCDVCRKRENLGKSLDESIGKMGDDSLQAWLFDGNSVHKYMYMDERRADKEIKNWANDYYDKKTAKLKKKDRK